MKVFFWIMRDYSHWDQIVLWDGEATYWTEQMHPSFGYKKIPSPRWNKTTGSRFIYLGDL